MLLVSGGLHFSQTHQQANSPIVVMPFIPHLVHQKYIDFIVPPNFYIVSY